MSYWGADQESVVEDQSEFISSFPKKSSIKIDATSKLQVIQALDSGQCKSDIAREYGVHPQTISSIYKQKDSIIRKYNHKYNLLKKICSLNLEQKLLDWFEEQSKSGNNITDDHLRIKAQILLEGLSEELTCIDDWLCSFRTRHNISKFTGDNVCNVKAKEDWKQFHNSLETKDIYIGGVCALSHNLDFNGFLSGQDPDSYVSLMFTVNILGSDKRELAVVGQDVMDTESHVRSLPVNYYYCANSQINYSILLSYLTKWENELASKGKHVVLVLDIPESLIENLCFDNIRIIGTSNLRYVKTILEKIVDCYKYQYRRLQISRTLTYGKDNTSFMEYVHMIGLAWYNTPEKYIRNLCFPPGDGSLYFNVKEDIDSDHSISRWCKMYNVPINLEHCSETLDKYIFCDSKLPCIYCGPLDETMQATEVLTQKVCHPTSGMEAYQAMKRIVSYLQAESAGPSIMKYAKDLENHLEYGALLQMHQIIASSNDPI